MTDRLLRLGIQQFLLLVIAGSHTIIPLRQAHDLQILRHPLLSFLDLVNIDLLPL